MDEEKACVAGVSRGRPFMELMCAKTLVGLFLLCPFKAAVWIRLSRSLYFWDHTNTEDRSVTILFC
jgi:hypothetical protein